MAFTLLWETVLTLRLAALWILISMSELHILTLSSAHLWLNKITIIFYFGILWKSHSLFAFEDDLIFFDGCWLLCHQYYNWLTAVRNKHYILAVGFSGGNNHEYCLWTVCCRTGRSIMSQDLLGLCCLIETRDRIERITLTAVLFD